MAVTAGKIIGFIFLFFFLLFVGVCVYIGYDIYSYGASALAGLDNLITDPLGTLFNINVTTNCNTYGNNKGSPTTCPSGRELYASTCVLACPSGSTRTAACTCDDLKVTTNCSLYGTSHALGSSGGPICTAANTEYYAGFCYNSCPSGYTRTAACTCQRGSLPVTDCTKYGSQGTPQQSCPSGYSLFQGLCYTNQCEVDGGTRTASDTCDFGSYQGVDTDCSKYYNQSCPIGYNKTAICSCQKGGIVTDAGRYDVTQTPTQSCPSGQQLYGGLCYTSCPSGLNRTAACTCSDPNYDLQTDCTKYGSTNQVPNGCPAGSDYFGSVCYSAACPSGSKRTASCTCQSGTGPTTDCSKYGDPQALGSPQGPQCAAGQDYFAGLCYSAQCPSGSKRTAACSCQAPSGSSSSSSGSSGSSSSSSSSSSSGGLFSSL